MSGDEVRPDPTPRRKSRRPDPERIDFTYWPGLGQFEFHWHDEPQGTSEPRVLGFREKDAALHAVDVVRRSLDALHPPPAPRPAGERSYCGH